MSVKTEKIYNLYCDGNDCKKRFSSMTKTTVELRAEARKNHGWKHTKSKDDYCPECHERVREKDPVKFNPTVPSREVRQAGGWGY